MPEISAPIIYELDYGGDGIGNFESDVQAQVGKDAKFLLHYPTVYIVNDESKRSSSRSMSGRLPTSGSALCLI